MQNYITWFLVGMLVAVTARFVIPEELLVTFFSIFGVFLFLFILLQEILIRRLAKQREAAARVLLISKLIEKNLEELEKLYIELQESLHLSASIQEELMRRFIEIAFEIHQLEKETELHRKAKEMLEAMTGEFEEEEKKNNIPPKID